MIFLCCALFLSGSFYCAVYQKLLLNQTEITGKIYVDAVGKVAAIKKFYNPINGLEGANLVIVQPSLYKSNSLKNPETTKKSSRKKPEGEVAGKVAGKLVGKLGGKPRKISEKNIQKNFLNLEDYQEIDRKFLDYSANYQHVNWVGTKHEFPNPPQKISVNLVKNVPSLAVNDLIAARMFLQPPKEKDFPDDFDFRFDAKAKRIGAHGFVIGEIKILQKGRVSSIEEWFKSLREKIRTKISTTLQGDESAVAAAFLIGDQGQISAELLKKIRISGLAHLLSVSGFHLSLAGAFFFISIRFLLSRSEHFTLHYNIKKISGILAIFGTFFYLKISGSPIPAQRAFAMILLASIALLCDEKLNARRAILIAALALILLNPYAILNIGFQLSFVAILTLLITHEALPKHEMNHFRNHPVNKFFRYFFEIILVSILIQITTLPFLIRSFPDVPLLGFISNVFAIPVASFFVMPLGFLSLLAMPINLDEPLLMLMGNGIIVIEKIAIFVADIDHSSLRGLTMPSLGLFISTLGLLLIFLTKDRLRFIGIAVFLLSFLTIYFAMKTSILPDILLDGKQKFFALYDKENGLVFSKNLRPSKQRESWIKKMGEDDFRSLKNTFIKEISCDELKCKITKNRKILILLARNKISEICKDDFDVIVNLTRKYALPNCIQSNKIKIDNFDFYHNGGHFLYLKNAAVLIKTSSGMVKKMRW